MGGAIMSDAASWQFELEEYIKQGEPGKIEKSEAWQTPPANPSVQ